MKYDNECYKWEDSQGKKPKDFREKSIAGIAKEESVFIVY